MFDGTSTLSSAASLTASYVESLSAETSTPPLIKAAPALPAPAGTIVNVSTEAQLQTAVRNLRSNTTILLAPGYYDLTSMLHVHDVSNVAIRSSTGNRDDVVLRGRGMNNSNYGDVPTAILLANAHDVTIADLTIRNVWYHGVAMNTGTERPLLHNLRIVDTGEQHIKSNPDNSGGGVDGGIVEYSLIEYTTTAKDHYTNGVDVHTGAGWIIRNNVFRNLRGPEGQLGGPAVLVWNGSRSAITEGNLFLNVERGIHYGLVDRVGSDNQGGVIRNNFFHRSPDQSGDLAIGVYDSPDTQVQHNTIILNGTYQNAIEYRYAGTARTQIKNNLTDAAIAARDGASGAVAGNITWARPDWFVDANAGDLHLARVTAAVDAAVVTSVINDYDRQARPDGAAADVGADELITSVVPGPNHAPVLNNTLSPRLKSIAEDAPTPASTQVASLIAGAVTDSDANASRGIVVTGAANTNGKWFYSLDGANYQELYEPSDAAARLLPESAYLRFMPNRDFHGTVKIYYRAWDQTQGASGDVISLNGSWGGVTPFSAAYEVTTLSVTAVNDRPVLRNLGSNLGFTKNTAAVSLATGAIVTDVDSANFGGGRLRVRIDSGSGSSNRLAVGTGFGIDASNNVWHNGAIIGKRISNGTGTNELIVTFNSKATRATVEQLVRSITFKTVGGSAGQRRVLFTVSDGKGGVSDTATKFVDVV